MNAEDTRAISPGAGLMCQLCSTYLHSPVKTEGEGRWDFEEARRRVDAKARLDGWLQHQSLLWICRNCVAWVLRTTPRTTSS